MGMPLAITIMFLVGTFDHLSYYGEELYVKSHVETRKGTAYNGYTFYQTERKVYVCDEYEPNPKYDGNLGDWRKTTGFNLDFS